MCCKIIVVTLRHINLKFHIGHKYNSIMTEIERFRDLPELIRWLNNGKKLLTDMFNKRKTVLIHYNEAVEMLDGNETCVQYLINHGVIVHNPTSSELELDEAYQTFFENTLGTNEEINVASVQQYIKALQLNIQSYLATSNAHTKLLYLRDIRHNFRSIAQIARKNVIDLRNKIDSTYKQTEDIKLKKIHLDSYNESRNQIITLIDDTFKIMKSENLFFYKASDDDTKQTIKDVEASLIETRNGLTSLSDIIIDYLNRFEYQDAIIKKIRRLKYLSDQQLLRESTNISEIIHKDKSIWWEKDKRYSTLVSLDFLRNEDKALKILSDVRQGLSGGYAIKPKIAGPMSVSYTQPRISKQYLLNHQKLINIFLSQSTDLFTFIFNYPYKKELTEEEKLVLFLQLASQYNKCIRYSGKFNKHPSMNQNIKFPVIYPR